MILGAGIYQVPLIRTARRMGLYTIVVSIPGDYPGFALADKIYELNTQKRTGGTAGYAGILPFFQGTVFLGGI